MLLDFPAKGIILHSIQQCIVCDVRKAQPSLNDIFVIVVFYFRHVPYTAVSLPSVTETWMLSCMTTPICSNCPPFSYSTLI